MPTTKLMSREEYERQAANNPDAPTFEEAKRRVTKQLIGQAVRSIDNGEPGGVSASYLASAMNVLLEREDG